MLALMEVVYANMDFGTAGHPARQLLAQEESGTPPQRFGPFDFIVIRKGEQAHTTALEAFVDCFRIAVTFAANFSKESGASAWSGEV